MQEIAFMFYQIMHLWYLRYENDGKNLRNYTIFCT